MTLDETIQLELAAAECWDAIVVGAGPAGSIAAHQLAKAGLRTLLVERKSFPREKVCGDCINGRAISLLRQLKLHRLLNQLGAIPLHRFHVRCGPRRGEIPLPVGVAVSRAAFDSALVEAAIAVGAEFLPQTSATLVDATPADSVRTVQLVRRGQSITTVAARVVLLADGLGNPSLPPNHPLAGRIASHSRIGIGGTIDNCPPDYKVGTIYMAVGSAGYVGLVRVEGDRLNIAAALDPAKLNRDRRPAAAIASILAETGLAESTPIETVDWTGTVPLTRRSHKPAGHRVLLLGDAAGYVEPFTGEGIANALTSGAAAANLATRSLAAWNVGVELEWHRRHQELFTDRQRLSRRLARLLWHPWAVRGLLGGLSIAPWLARPIVKRLNESPVNNIKTP